MEQLYENYVTELHFNNSMTILKTCNNVCGVLENLNNSKLTEGQVSCVNKCTNSAVNLLNMQYNLFEEKKDNLNPLE